jgi:hypothetical protein
MQIRTRMSTSADGYVTRRAGGSPAREAGWSPASRRAK